MVYGGLKRSEVVKAKIHAIDHITGMILERIEQTGTEEYEELVENIHQDIEFGTGDASYSQ